MTTQAPPRPRARPVPKAKAKRPRPKRPGPTAIDPRMRARRVEVKRAEGRRRLHRLGAVLVLLGLVTGAVGAAFSPLLDVDRVRVVGTELSAARAAEVRAAAEIEVGSPLLFTDTGAIEDRVERLAWVADARVARHFPGTLTVTVAERVPVAWAAADDGTARLVDRRGTVVAGAPTPPPGLPQLLGADPAATAAVAPVAARVAAEVPAAIRAGVAGIAVEHDQAVLRLAIGTEVRLGAPSGIAAKARAAEAVLRALGLRLPSYVDVRVPSAPVTG